MAGRDTPQIVSERVAAETFRLSAALLSTETIEFPLSMGAVMRDSINPGLTA